MNISTVSSMWQRLARAVRVEKTDRIVLYGWIAILLSGQCLLNRQVPALEWAAVAWLAVGMLVVRRTFCLPLLLLTCPAYMCEVQRHMAWTQPLIVTLLLARVFFGDGLTAQKRLWVMLCGVLILVVSWPADWAALLREINTFPRHDWPGHFLYAHAQWAMYPFRQTADRALLAALVAAVFLDGRYFSTRRVWRAYAYCGILMLIASLCAALLPWHRPHLFLGTTNYASWSAWTLSGAGYNVIFLTLPMATLLPAVIFPFWTKRRWLAWGLCGLLLPVPFTNQRAIGLAMAAFFLVLAVFLVVSFTAVGRRRKTLMRFRGMRAHMLPAMLVFALSCSISLAWLFKMGVLERPAWFPGVRPAVQESEVREVERDGKEQPVRKAPAEKKVIRSNGSDLWYGNSNVLQGQIVFCKEADLWTALNAGTIITLAEVPQLSSEDESWSVDGSAVLGEHWIHVSTKAEANSGVPLVLTHSNIENGEDGAFLSGGHGWELTILDADGEPAFGPIGERMKGWQAGQVGDREVGRLEGDPWTADIGEYNDAKASTFGLPNMWNEGAAHQDLSALRARPPASAVAGLVLNEFNAVKEGRYVDGGDARLGALPGNGGPWIELVVTREGLDIRGWRLLWSVTGKEPLKYDWAIEEQRQIAERLTPSRRPSDRLRRWFKQVDRSRYFMWRLGGRHIAENGLWRGAGAGTWGRFHRTSPAPREWQVGPGGKARHIPMTDHPHMHNTFLDLVFEYGLVPMLLIYLLFIIALGGLWRRGCGASRLWLFYVVPVVVLAMFQHLFYAFMQMVVLIPMAIVTLRSLRAVVRRAVCH